MAKQIELSPNGGPLTGVADLPISKSIANRLLVLSAFSGQSLQIDQNDLPDDVRLMIGALSSSEDRIDLENAGTAIRFLTAYYSIQEGRNVILDGNEAMRSRPIDPLVEALRALGANIEYEMEEGFPPLSIQGKKLVGGEIVISGDVSSQYITALMLIASFLEDGLKINIIGKQVSASYLSLTADLINRSGGQVSITDGKVAVDRSSIDIQPTEIETDWSAASYFYAFAALRLQSELLLKGLRLNSAQGDKRIAEIMVEFGVSSIQDDAGVIIRSSSPAASASFSYDLSSQPDLVQTLACFHASRGDEVIYSGIDHLKFKETDRLSALQNELKKFGVEFLETEKGWAQSGRANWNGQTIKTYGDHRMAMAFSILALENSVLMMEEPEVVSKSFPSFWKHFETLTSA